MKIRHILFIALVLLLGLFENMGLSHAQDLTLQEVIDKAIQNDPQVKIAEVRLKKAGHALAQDKGFIPNFSVHSGYNPVTSSSSVGVSASFDLDKILTRKNEKQSEHDIATAQFNEAKALAKGRAVEAYLYLKRQEEYLQSKEELLTLERKQLSSLKRAVSSGNADPEGLSAKDSSFARALWEKRSAELECKRAQMNLELLTGTFQKDGN